MTVVKFWKAMNMALAEEMERDERVILLGEDVGSAGGVFGVSRGLQKRFGEWRVRDTPISENSLVGLAVGAAAAGLRPIVELMYLDFAMLAADQIVNQAAKYRYFSGGKSLPLVILTTAGAGGPHGAQHSQALEAWFTSVPGLSVVMPSNGADANALLKAAIRSEGPVLFIETFGLLRTMSEVSAGSPPGELSKASIRRPGNDLTIVSYGQMLNTSLAAAELLEAKGISAEIVDLRSLAPLDKTTVLESLSRTHRLMIVHEAHAPSGIGAEIAAVAANEGFDDLDAPILRITPPFVDTPVSIELANLRIPSVEEIFSAAIGLVRGTQWSIN